MGNESMEQISRDTRYRDGWRRLIRCRVTKIGANQEREEAAGNFRTEETITGVEDEGEIRTE